MWYKGEENQVDGNQLKFIRRNGNIEIDFKQF